MWLFWLVWFLFVCQALLDLNADGINKRSTRKILPKCAKWVNQLSKQSNRLLLFCCFNRFFRTLNWLCLFLFWLLKDVEENVKYLKNKKERFEIKLNELQVRQRQLTQRMIQVSHNQPTKQQKSRLPLSHRLVFDCLIFDWLWGAWRYIMAKIEATWTGRGYLTPEEERERLYERFRQLQQDIARSRQARSKSTDWLLHSFISIYSIHLFPFTSIDWPNDWTIDWLIYYLALLSGVDDPAFNEFRQFELDKPNEEICSVSTIHYSRLFDRLTTYCID